MERGVLFGKYETGRKLGSGAFAKVYYARNIQTGQSVAIKVINKQQIMERNLMSNIYKEITIMGRLRHPNIVRLYEVLACKKKIYFVIELAKGGELYRKVTKGGIGEELSRKYFQQLISAVGYCHFRGVFHRDLKPENLLLDEDSERLKVTDFGLGAIRDRVRSNEMLRTFCGTPAYVAPEIIGRQRYDGAKVDVWCCGVILYFLTAGFLPFNDPNLMALYKKIYDGKYRCPKWMSNDLIRFLGRLLETNPKNRISIDEIVHDPWFKRGGMFKDKGPEFEFPFYLDYHKPTRKQQRVVVGADEAVSTSIVPLNAFDLISFSPGLDLSGLFTEDYNPFEDSEKFFSAFVVEEIVTIVGEAAVEMGLKVCWRVEDCVVDLVEPKGNLIARVEIDQVTEQLVVVEVKFKAEDSEFDNNIWKEKLMPKLSKLVYDPNSQPAVEEIDTISRTLDELVNDPNSLPVVEEMDTSRALDELLNDPNTLPVVEKMDTSRSMHESVYEPNSQPAIVQEIMATSVKTHELVYDPNSQPAIVEEIMDTSVTTHELVYEPNSQPAGIDTTRTTHELAYEPNSRPAVAEGIDTTRTTHESVYEPNSQPAVAEGIETTHTTHELVYEPNSQPVVAKGIDTSRTTHELVCDPISQPVAEEMDTSHTTHDELIPAVLVDLVGC